MNSLKQSFFFICLFLSCSLLSFTQSRQIQFPEPPAEFEHLCTLFFHNILRWIPQRMVPCILRHLQDASWRHCPQCKGAAVRLDDCLVELLRIRFDHSTKCHFPFVSVGQGFFASDFFYCWTIDIVSF